MAVNVFKALLILFCFAGDISFLRAGPLGKRHLKGKSFFTLATPPLF